MLEVFEVVMDKLDDVYLKDAKKQQDEHRARQERDARREAQAAGRATQRVK